MSCRVRVGATHGTHDSSGERCECVAQQVALTHSASRKRAPETKASSALASHLSRLLLWLLRLLRFVWLVRRSPVRQFASSATREFESETRAASVGSIGFVLCALGCAFCSLESAFDFASSQLETGANLLPTDWQARFASPFIGSNGSRVECWSVCEVTQ